MSGIARGDWVEPTLCGKYTWLNSAEYFENSMPRKLK